MMERADQNPPAPELRWRSPHRASHVVVVGLPALVGERVEQQCVGRHNALADVSADALADRGDRGYHLCCDAINSGRENTGLATRSHGPEAI